MNKMQSLLTICFALSVAILALSGLAKLSALILATAIMTAAMTVFYGLIAERRLTKESVYRYNWK